MTAADLHLVLEKEQEAVVCALSTYLGTHMLTTYPPHPGQPPHKRINPSQTTNGIRCIDGIFYVNGLNRSHRGISIPYVIPSASLVFQPEFPHSSRISSIGSECFEYCTFPRYCPTFVTSFRGIHSCWTQSRAFCYFTASARVTLW
jgi:hypothetical protein